MTTHKRKPSPRHPAMDAMVAAAHGYLTAFERDLTVHDVRTLEHVPHGCAFSWIVNPNGTHLAVCNGSVPELAHPYVRMIDGRAVVSARGFAAMVDRTFTGCRFYFWTGAQLVQVATAAHLDERAQEWEAEQRECAEERLRRDRDATFCHGDGRDRSAL